MMGIFIEIIGVHSKWNRPVYKGVYLCCSVSFTHTYLCYQFLIKSVVFNAQFQLLNCDVPKHAPITSYTAEDHWADRQRLYFSPSALYAMLYSFKPVTCVYL
jgi:hypothetical protein